MGHSPWIDTLNRLISERMSGPAFEDRQVRVTGNSPTDAQYEFQGVTYGSPSQIPDVEVRKIVVRARSQVRDQLDLKSRVEKATGEKGEAGEASITTPGTTSSPVTLRWYQIWMSALTSPKVSTYEMISGQPAADSLRGIKWIVAAGVVGSAIWLLSSAVGINRISVAQSALSMVLVLGLAAVVVQAMGSVLGLAVDAGITNWVAGKLGGAGHYDRLAFTVAAYRAPFTLFQTIVTGPNLIRRLMSEMQPDATTTFIQTMALLAVELYGVVLHIMAVKAIYQLSWGRAITAGTVVTLGLPCLLLVCVYALMPALGGQLGNVIP